MNKAVTKCAAMHYTAQEHSIDTVTKENCNIYIIVVFHEVFLNLAL